MDIGDLVRPLSEPLHSGAETYDYAIVVQVRPRLVLVSPNADMRWEATIQDRLFVVVGTATADRLATCMKRL